MDLDVFTSGRQYEMFARLRASGPIHWNDEPDGPGFWSIVRYDDVKAAMTDQPRLSNADGTMLQSRRAEGKLHSLHNMDDPRHAKLRRIAAPYMRGIRVQAWQEMIHHAVTGLLDEAEAKGHIDVVHEIAARLPMLVLGRVLGVPRDDCPLMVDWTNRSPLMIPTTSLIPVCVSRPGTSCSRTSRTSPMNAAVSPGTT